LDFIDDAFEDIDAGFCSVDAASSIDIAPLRCNGDALTPIDAAFFPRDRTPALNGAESRAGTPALPDRARLGLRRGVAPTCCRRHDEPRLRCSSRSIRSVSKTFAVPRRRCVQAMHVRRGPTRRCVRSRMPCPCMHIER
jgi:hypothetical protein